MKECMWRVGEMNKVLKDHYKASIESLKEKVGDMDFDFYTSTGLSLDQGKFFRLFYATNGEFLVSKRISFGVIQEVHESEEIDDDPFDFQEIDIEEWY